jgi:hypothetical protein
LGKPWTIEGVDNKAIYLCIALMYDTGKRISNFTHKDGVDAEDHCIRTHDVHFVFSPDSVTIPVDEQFKDYMTGNNIDLKDITHAQLHFYTQKEGYKNTITIEPPITISRGTVLESELLDNLIEWCLFNRNFGEAELLTRNMNNRVKHLTRRKVGDAIKNVAEKLNLDPNQFGTRLLRSGFTTVTSIHCKEPGTHESDLLRRGGWAKNSRVPQKYYNKSTDNEGALSYPENSFNRQYLNRLTPKRK